MNRVRCGLILAILLIMSGSSLAQDSTTPSGAGGSPCASAEAAQFDFWLGEWDVLAQEKVVGRNVITRIHGGCTLYEEYAANGGPFEGKSFNYFDPTDQKWHQVWVDNSGTRLHLAGGYDAGRMVMSGQRVVNGKTVTDRISWTDNPDGTVRQHWELSHDDGATWQTLFDGLYRRVADQPEGEAE